jgi:hypothetical protein
VEPVFDVATVILAAGKPMNESGIECVGHLRPNSAVQQRVEK